MQSPGVDSREGTDLDFFERFFDFERDRERELEGLLERDFDFFFDFFDFFSLDLEREPDLDFLRGEGDLPSPRSAHWQHGDRRLERLPLRGSKSTDVRYLSGALACTPPQMRAHAQQPPRMRPRRRGYGTVGIIKSHGQDQQDRKDHRR